MNEKCCPNRCISCPLPLYVFFTSVLIILTCMPSCQSPTRAFLLKMAVQRRAAETHPPRPGSACSFKRISAMEAELIEARPSSACFHHPPLPNKLAEKVKRGSIVQLERWPLRPNGHDVLTRPCVLDAGANIPQPGEEVVLAQAGQVSDTPYTSC